ncbi:hypothetical protein MHU86_2493 [Fragilaria crotonensis]|nr:hypothetical protein MHU86_2493 [Fragilaria crotonensis]
MPSLRLAIGVRTNVECVLLVICARRPVLDRCFVPICAAELVMTARNANHAKKNAKEHAITQFVRGSVVIRAHPVWNRATGYATTKGNALSCVEHPARVSLATSVVAKFYRVVIDVHLFVARTVLSSNSVRFVARSSLERPT